MSCIVLDVIGCWPGRGKTWPILGVQFADSPAYCDAISRGSLVSGYHVMASFGLCFPVAPRDNSKETLSQENIIYGIIGNLDVIINIHRSTSLLPSCPFDTTGTKGISYLAILDFHRHYGVAPFRA